MKRKRFLQKLFATLCTLPLLSRFTRAEPKAPTDLETLEENYYKAANALTKYRHGNGFEPGVRVRTQSRFGDEPMLGVIAPYGEQWSTVGKTSVPVLLDRGYCQPWCMSSLVVLRSQ